MGEQTSSLRVKKLSDLIHGASISRPVDTNYASVSANIYPFSKRRCPRHQIWSGTTPDKRHRCPEECL